MNDPWIAAGQELAAVITAENAALAALDRIAAAVGQSIADKQIAGAVTMVVRHGHVAWLCAGHVQ